MDYYSEFIKVYEKARGDFSEERAIEIAKFITKQKAIDEREKARHRHRKISKEKILELVKNMSVDFPLIQDWVGYDFCEILARELRKISEASREEIEEWCIRWLFEEEKKERKEEQKKEKEGEFEPATDRQISYAKDLGIDVDFDHISKQRLSELIDKKLKETKGD